MKVHPYSKALSWITRPRVTETATAETYTPELERMNFKPEKSKADQYKEYLKAEPFLEPESQIYARDQLGFDEGGQVIGKPGGLVEPGVTHYAKPELSRRGHPKIKGALLKSPWLKDKKKAWKEIKKLRQKFITKHGRTPNKQEFAKFSGYSKEALTKAQDTINLQLAKGPTKEALTAGAYKRGEIMRAKSVDQPTIINLGPAGKQVKGGVRWQNEKVKKEVLDQLRLRHKYPRLSAEGKAAGVLSNAELKVKYFKPTTSDASVKEVLIEAARDAKIKPDYPSVFGKEAEESRTYSKRRKIKIKKISDWKYEKKIKGTPNTHLHHMQSKRFNVTTRNLGYAPPKMNVDTLVGIERKLDSLYLQREKLLKDKPKDLIKKLEDINVKGMNIVADPKVKGYLNFKIMDPKTLKMNDYGVDIAKTIDPADLLKGKAIKDLTEADKALIELNRATIMKREIGPTAVPAFKKLLSTASDSMVNRIGAVLGCRKVAAEGGRIGLKDGSGLMQCISSKLDNDPRGALAKVAKDVPETRGPMRSALGMTGKAFGKFLMGALSPAGIVGTTVGFGVDPKSAVDRMGVAGEAAFAPELVKSTIGATKGMKNRGAQKVIQQLLNLGMPTQTALRVARVAQPLGLLYLGGEGLYKMYKEGHFDKERMMPSLMNKEAYESAQQEQFDVNQPMLSEGGRASFKKGTKFSPSRRLFIKGVGAAALLPFVGKYFKLAKPTAKAAAEYTGPVLEGLGEKLKWVQSLAKRLWNEGDDVTKTASTMDRQVVKRGTLESGDEVDMIYDIDTNNVRFDVSPKKTETGFGYETKSGAYNKGYGVEYKAPQVIEEGKHAGKKTKSDISVGEVEGRMTPDDVDWDFREADVDEAMSDLTELEAFAKKKTVKQIHKKKGTKPKDVSPEADWDNYLPDIDDID
jgi:hypothetical protein